MHDFDDLHHIVLRPCSDFMLCAKSCKGSDDPVIDAGHIAASNSNPDETSDRSYGLRTRYENATGRRNGRR
jgi:hypothetical protein